MTNKTFAYLTISFLPVCLLCIFFIDQPLAFFIDSRLQGVQSFFNVLTGYAEIATGFPVSKYLPGFVFLAIAAIILLIDRGLLRAKLFFFLALTFMFSRFAAGLLKNVFERTRPFDLVETGQFGRTFFIDGGSSFPSGHTAHFWGLFLPLIFLFPKYRIPLLIVPVTIGLGRIIVNDHYPSDVLASVYIAFFFTFALAKAMNIQMPYQFAYSKDDEAT